MENTIIIITILIVALLLWASHPDATALEAATKLLKNAKNLLTGQNEPPDEDTN